MWNKLFLITFFFISAHGRLMAKAEPTGTAGEDSVFAFKEFRLFNKSVVAGQKLNGRILLHTSINRMRSVSLNHNENVFSFEFAAPLYLHKDKIRYQYQMEGFDKDWTFFDDNSQKVTYTNLDAGRYTLKIKSAGNTARKEKIISMGILVMPSYWHTPLAYLIYSISILCLLLLLRKRDIEKLMARFDAEKEKASVLMRSELDMMKKKFFTNVSYETTVPLLHILAPVEKLLASQPGQEFRYELNLIKRNAKHLLNLVNQLMDFRKMEYHELKLNKTTGNLIAFIEERTLSFQENIENSSICVIFDSDIPAFYTSFDHDKVERILLNLLSNAFKFTPGKGRISVLVSLKEPVEPNISYIEINVIDTGIGISADTLRKIFEPFFQHSLPASMINQGSGIGLAIIRAFVKIQQGTISVKSEPGTGTSFCICLPFEHLSMPVSAAEPEELKLEILPGYLGVKVASSAEEVKKPLVLIVESNDDLRQYMKANLHNDFTILEASTGKEGWQKALAHHPGLIISDIRLGGTNGRDLCLKIKKDLRTCQIKVILLAAEPDDESILKEIGADELLAKPFNLQVLKFKMADLLGQADRMKRGHVRYLENYPDENPELSSDNLFLQKVFSLVEQNLSNPKFSIEEFSSEMFMSRYTLYKKILALTGKSPVEFLRSMRMKKAARLLENGKHSLSEICMEVGFKNQKYFTKSFKSAFNTLPANFVESTLIP